MIKAERRKAKHGRKKPLVLRDDHKAVVGAETLFPTTVRIPDTKSELFKPGGNNSKIGSHVTKGAWKGMPIYTLSLEERATCPRVCEHWKDCYGNHMPFARRWKAGRELKEQIPIELRKLAKKHPGGFVVRLHVLGDFYSATYVALWQTMMFEMPQLHVYGYTRRDKDSGPGLGIDFLNYLHPNRWRIRWSERGGEMGTHTTADTSARGRTEQGIVCPAQTEGDEVCCGNCTLCWATTAPIVFINH